ncbi:MAG: hypothetical protein WBA87_02165 [Microbacterium sp.]
MTVLVAGVGMYGLIAGTQPGVPSDPTSSSARPPAAPPLGQATTASRLPTISHGHDAEAFARSIATALFRWDTGSGFLPLDYAGAILDVAESSGIEGPGLAADIANYLPTQTAWLQLRKYSTTQRLEVTSASVPHAWSEALAQARPGQLPAGATAYTIEGIRHRTGTWNGNPVTVQQEIAFTVFIACPHDGGCSALRLSELNNPLR